MDTVPNLLSLLILIIWGLLGRYEAQSAQDWEFIVRDSESKLLIVANEAIRERTQAFLGHVTFSFIAYISLFLGILIELSM